MKRLLKYAAAVCLALLIAVQTAFSAAAHEKYTEPIFDYFSDEGSDIFYELEFGENDWGALCHMRLYGLQGAEDYLDRVEAAAEDMLQRDGFVKPTELQRAVILLSAADRCSQRLVNAAVYNNSFFGRQGLNSYIWGLVALNCCETSVPENAVNTMDSMTRYILSKQLADGGFALTGAKADTDITASVIYALAPLREDSADISSALDKAEKCLTDLQQPDGGFCSMGTENCESTAQAIMALCALGYDSSDERMSTALTALEAYRCADGGYSHAIGTDSSGLATAQTLMAYASLEMSARGEQLFTELTSSAEEQPDSETAEDAPQKNDTNDIAQAENDIQQQSTLNGDVIKLVVISMSGAAGIALIAVWLIKGRKRTLLLLAGVALAVLALVISMVRFSSPEEYYASGSSAGEIAVTLTIDCTAALENAEKAQVQISLPENGLILSEYRISVGGAATAFDALLSAARQEKIAVDHVSSPLGDYVSGIGGLYEFDYGSESGWLYRVNGESPLVSMSHFSLKDGDSITIEYTCELGR